MKPSIQLFLIIITGSCLTVAAQQNLPYSQDFEGVAFPPANWEFFGSNTNASWERSSTVGAYGNSSACMYFDNFTTDLSGNYYGIRAVSLDLTNATKPMLKFDVAYARKSASNSDRLGIWYSFNGTSGWNNLMNFQNSTLTTAPDQATFFTPTASEWDSIVVDLTQFAGESFIRFAFENNCDFGNVMYIDNVLFYDADDFTGINEPTGNTAELIIYPNPSSGGKIQLILKNITPDSYSLFDPQGKEVAGLNVLKTGDELYELNTSQLAGGIYHLLVISEDQVISKKIHIL